MGHLNDTRPTPRPQADKDTLMKQYQLMVDAYLKYLDLVQKLALFNYAITGAILSFYLSQKTIEGVMRFGLVFPIIMNLTFAVFSFFASRRISPIRDEINRVVVLLSLEAFPDANFLKFILLMVGGLFTLTAICLTVLSCSRY